MLMMLPLIFNMAQENGVFSATVTAGGNAIHQSLLCCNGA
jgi:hypothetical protein